MRQKLKYTREINQIKYLRTKLDYCTNYADTVLSQLSSKSEEMIPPTPSIEKNIGEFEDLSDRMYSLLEELTATLSAKG
jgi:hypothetical protein